MPLSPPPTIQAGLALVVQKLLRSDMSRAAEVTFALSVADPPSFATAQDTIDDFQTNFAGNFGPMLDTEVLMVQPTIRLGDGSTVPFVATAAGAATNGAAATTSLPPNAALLLRKSTPVGGRKARGRTYLPFCMSESEVSENGTVSGALQALANAKAAGFLAQLVLDTTPLCIANHTFNVPAPPHHVVDITIGQLVNTYTCEPIIATQRRRLGR